MAHTYTFLTYHIIFGTKDRIPCIEPELEKDLHAYMAGIVLAMKGKPLLINGTPDHVHLLVQLGPTNSLSEFLRILKANSSKWVHDEGKSRMPFSWQNGYGAFAVSKSGISGVFNYVLNQKDHHKKISYKDEFLSFLRIHNIPYDERYIWE